jgi:hypothetical protein
VGLKTLYPNLTSDLSISINSLSGYILFAPQSAGSSTQGSVTLTGIASLSANGSSATFLANWTGNIVPLQPGQTGPLNFSLSGNLTPTQPDAALTQYVAQIWGYNPTITLAGTVDPSLDVMTVKATGALTPVASSAYGATPPPPPQAPLPAPPPPATPPPISVSIHQGAAHAAATKSAAASSASSGTTSFGSLTDFTLVYGLDGGPNWKFKTFTGPSGTTPFVSVNRTNLDSLSITFVPACQDFTNIQPQFKTFWDTIGPCDIAGNATAQGAAFAFQNNNLMLLRNFVIHPAGQ